MSKREYRITWAENIANALAAAEMLNGPVVDAEKIIAKALSDGMDELMTALASTASDNHPRS